MLLIDIQEAQARLAELIDLAIPGKEIIITRDSEPIAKLVRFSTTRKSPTFGSAKGKITMRKDLDEPLEDFREYVQ